MLLACGSLDRLRTVGRLSQSQCPALAALHFMVGSGDLADNATRIDARYE